MGCSRLLFCFYQCPFPRDIGEQVSLFSSHYITERKKERNHIILDFCLGVLYPSKNSAKCETKDSFLKNYLRKWTFTTCVFRAVAVFRQLWFFTVVLSPGRARLSRSSLDTFLCQSRGRQIIKDSSDLEPSHLGHLSPCAFLREYNKRTFFPFFPSFSVLGDCGLLSPILRIWTRRDPATLSNFSFPFVLLFQLEKSHAFSSNTVKGKAILRLLFSRPILFYHYCSDFEDVISEWMSTEASPGRWTLTGNQVTWTHSLNHKWHLCVGEIFALW